MSQVWKFLFSSLALAFTSAVAQNEVIPPQYTVGFLEAPEVVWFPLSNDTQALELGNAVDFGAAGNSPTIHKFPSSVFSAAAIPAPKSELPDATIRSVEQFDVIQNVDIRTLTRESALAVQTKARGLWGSASASYNETHFSSNYKNKLVAHATMKSDGPVNQVNLEGLSLTSFKPEVQRLITDARAAIGDKAALAKIREQFREQFGTAFVAQEQTGARLIIEISTELNQKDSIDTQRKSFGLAVHGLGFGSVSGDVVQTGKQTKTEKTTDLHYRAIIQGGEGSATEEIGDLKKTVSFANQWIKGARKKQARLGLGIQPYKSLAPLVLIASDPRDYGQLQQTQVLQYIEPLIDGKPGQDYAPIAAILQYSTGWGALDYALLPLPTPLEVTYDTPSKGEFSVVVQFTPLDGELLKVCEDRWTDLKEKVQRNEPKNYIYMKDIIPRPELIGDATIRLDIDYPTTVPETDRLIFEQGIGPKENEPRLSPSIQALYLNYPSTSPDRFSFIFRGTDQAITNIKKDLKNGVTFRAVLELDGIQRIALEPFVVQTGADGRTLARPKRIPVPNESDALRELQQLKDQSVSQQMLTLSKQVTLDGKQSYFKGGQEVIAIPPGYKARVVATGLINIWGKTPSQPPDDSGGRIYYSFDARGGGKVKAGSIKELDNTRGQSGVMVYAAIVDDDPGNNSGFFKLDAVVVPSKVPFPALTSQQKTQ